MMAEKRVKARRKHHLRGTHFAFSKKTDYILLAVILSVAALLRLFRFPELPFMHDELSALFRTDFDNISDLVKLGVFPDSHPMGVQVFLYYWVKLVGMNELWVKLPFALMGIASVYLTFVVGKLWYSRKAGLMASAVMAVSQFTVFYSQLARPYAFGMFFMLLFVVAWTKIVFGQKSPSVWLCVGFAVTAALTALSHNFATAAAGLVFLTGLVFLPKERRKHYWLSAVGALLLYSPNLYVFYHQLFEYGSIGGWLSKPTPSFLTDFVQYTFNYSGLFMFVAGVVALLPLIYGKKRRGGNAMRIVSLLWFLIVFAVAYLYSMLREPILQYSTLIFVYPFLLLTLFSMFGNRSVSGTVTALAVFAVLFAGAESLVIDRQHYSLMYEQGFDGMAKMAQDDKASLGDVSCVTWSDNPLMSDFYQRQADIGEYKVLGRENDMADMSNVLCNSKSRYLCFGWTDYADPRYDVMASVVYPYKIGEKTWFASHGMTLAQQPQNDADAELAFHYLNDAPVMFDGEWTMSFTVAGDSLADDTDIFGVAVDACLSDTVRGCQMVLEVRDAQTDSLLLWCGAAHNDTLRPQGRNIIASAFRFSALDVKPQDVKMKFYLWNRPPNKVIISRIGYYTSVYDKSVVGLNTSLH